LFPIDWIPFPKGKGSESIAEEDRDLPVRSGDGLGYINQLSLAALAGCYRCVNNPVFFLLLSFTAEQQRYGGCGGGQAEEVGAPRHHRGVGDVLKPSSFNMEHLPSVKILR